MHRNRTKSRPLREVKEHDQRRAQAKARTRRPRAGRKATDPPALHNIKKPDASKRRDAVKDAATILHALVEGVREGAAILSSDQTVLTCNQNLAGMLKLDAEQIIGRPIFSFLTSDDQFALKALLQSCPEDLRIHVHLNGANKRPLPIELVIKTLEIDGTRIMSLLATDRRDYRRAQEQLRLQAHILANVSDAVVATDEQQRITFWNPAAERLYGFTAAEVLGRPVHQVVRSEVTPEQSAAFIRELREKGKLQAQVIHYDRQGRRLLIQGVNSKLVAPDGQVLGFIGVSHDITEERRDEEQLREQAALLDLTRDAIFVRDPESRITFWNRGAETMYGWSRTEAMGRSVQDLLHTEFPRPLEEIERAVERDGHWEGELLHTARLGKEIPVHSRWSLLRDVQGKPIAILQINTDITERRRAENEIRRLNADLERRVVERTAELENEIATHRKTEQALRESDQQVKALNRDLQRRAVQFETANKELESFSYSVSHDLRTPLASIDSFSRLLYEEYNEQLPPGGRRYVEFIRANAQQMGELIESLLTFSRLTRQPIQKQNVDMVTIVREALEMLQNQTQRSDLSIEIMDLPDAEADPVLLRQVWMNLVGNALKFTRKRENAHVKIGCGALEDEEHVYYVRDNGVGFDQEQAERLFGVFQRFHGEEEYEGHGVGLATVQRIIHRHGGRVWAEGEEEKGATFYFTLG